jgi:HIT domain
MGVSDPGCVFCDIVRDTRKCALIAEDETSLAFMDIHPANDGHCLVIPKSHHPTILDIPPNIFMAVSSLVVRVACAHSGRAAATRPEPGSGKWSGGESDRAAPAYPPAAAEERRWPAAQLPRTAEGDPARIAEIAEQIRRHLRP